MAMIDEAVRSVLTEEGPASFVTTGPAGAHLVATWQSYLEIVDDATFAFPAAGYLVTEDNLKAGSACQMIIGRQRGPAGPSLGFRLTGSAAVQEGTPIHQQVKAKFPWCRAAVVFTVTAVERILG
jgi:hypothetical protein